MATYESAFGSLHDTYLPEKPAPPDPVPPKQKLRVKPIPPRKVTPTPVDKIPPLPGSLGIPGLPPELEAQIQQILAADPTNGVTRAIAFLRGTDWFKTTYAGFEDAIKSGLISPGADAGSFGSALGWYRGYAKQVNDIFQKNYGRVATAGELVNFLRSGYDLTTVGQIAGGHAITAANSADWNYYAGAFDTGQLSEAEKTAFGELQAGRSSDLGLRVKQKVDNAYAKFQKLFEGQLASPSLSLGSGGLSAPSLQTKQKPDVQA